MIDPAAKLMKTVDIVATGRHRKDMGDIDALADSIRKNGLYHAIGVQPSGILLYGERRLRACKKLGWAEIPVRVLDVPRIVAEYEENGIRKDFTPSEAVAIAEAYEAEERKAAEDRKRDGQRKGRDVQSGVVPAESAGTNSAGETRAKVAAAVGMSHDTLAKARKVVTDGAPELVEAMDEGDVSVDAAAALSAAPPEVQREVVAKGKAEILREAKRIKQEQSRERAERKRRDMVLKAAAAPALLATEWEVRHGDCLRELKRIEAETFRVVFTDPPYNIGIDYGDGADADSLDDAAYMEWCERWLRECVRVLKPDGSLWVMIGDEYAAEYVVAMKGLGLTLRNWIKWFEAFGVNTENKFNRTSRHILYFVKDPNNYVFNPLAVSRPSDRQAKYDDARANPNGKVWDDVWGINPPLPRVTGTSDERIPDFPTQIPVALTRAVVGCASDPGDWVLDPFNGSGTTGAAAIELGRNYVGIEKQERFADLARTRLQGVRPVQREVDGAEALSAVR